MGFYYDDADEAEDGVTTSVSKELSGDSAMFLASITTGFRDFLRSVGFDYVTDVVVVKGGGEEVGSEAL